MSVADYQCFRSTRIPDFVRRRFYLDDNFNIKASRIDMVVEVKRSAPTPGKTKHRLVKAEPQAREQAAHALAEDKRLTVVGWIAAVGNVWRSLVATTFIIILRHMPRAIYLITPT